MNILLMVFLGLAAGVFSGLFGVGGGALMVPVFFYLFKMDIQKAIGTSLFVIIFIALVGSIKHFTLGNIEFKNLIFFILAALVGGWLGATLTGVFPISLLKKIFAVFLLFIAVFMFIKS